MSMADFAALPKDEAHAIELLYFLRPWEEADSMRCEMARSETKNLIGEQYDRLLSLYFFAEESSPDAAKELWATPMYNALLKRNPSTDSVDLPTGLDFGEFSPF